MPVLHSAIVQHAIDVAALIERVQAESVGAVSIFLGTVRDCNDGKPVTGIDYDAYESMAERELLALATEVCATQPQLRIALEHRVGTLGVGDVSVAIAAAHPHRAEACDSARAIIEAVKVRVPVWKCEHYADGSREWIDPTATVHVSAVSTAAVETDGNGEGGRGGGGLIHA